MSTSQGLNVSLWVLQGLLALAFGMVGIMKATKPIADLAPMMPWVASVPAALIRFIGVAELAGAVGLILPAASRVRPSLTPLAAAGLALVVALAVPFHASRGELQVLPANLILGALAGFVAWGRLRKAPIRILLLDRWPTGSTPAYAHHPASVAPSRSVPPRIEAAKVA